MKTILITGAGGYIGTNLVSKLIKLKYKVVALDTFWFGNYLKKNKRLKILKKDIRKLDLKDLNNIDTIIHLASIANDPAAELNAKLTWDINVLATYNLIDLAVKKKIKKFIFASSGSVYGIKKEKKVIEDLPLHPVSEYNKSKRIAERILLIFKKKIDLTILRPATVCGYSPSMRLDVAVNALTFNALKNNKIKVFGGKQIRPNLNMFDMVNAYVFSIQRKYKKDRRVKDTIFNIGFENLSILNIAKRINKCLLKKYEIDIIKSNDPRSYRQDSSRILAVGFSPKKTIKDAIIEIKEKFLQNKIKRHKKFYRVNTLKIIKVK